MLTAAAEAAFDAFDFSGRRVVAAAVSGGGDSLALLVLLAGHLACRAPFVRLLAFTVDHRLRPESAAEAERVAAFCAGRGIAHRTLAWEGDKPRHGLAEAAREARYRLLAAAATAAGADLLFTGHTLDDQIETVAMRMRRGEGPGLAGMAPATLYEGAVWIVRPLLSVSRAALRGVLSGMGLGWIEDPSNRDRRYERGRLRAELAGAAARRQALAERALEAAAARVDLGERAATLIERHAQQVAAGLYRLAPGLAEEADREAAVHALRILLAVAGGRERLADAARTGALFKRLRMPGPCVPLRGTLSRAVVEARRDGLFLHRERRGLPGPVPAVAGAAWDGRRRLAAAGGEGVVVAPFGAAAPGFADLPSGLPHGVPRGLPPRLARTALAAEPALWRGGECLGAAPAVAVAAPFFRFLSSFDLAPARAAGRLAGAAEIPPPPFARRNGPRKKEATGDAAS